MQAIGLITGGNHQKRVILSILNLSSFAAPNIHKKMRWCEQTQSSMQNSEFKKLQQTKRCFILNVSFDHMFILIA
jgi:hypothetical protein